ncbi:hypothetical protein HDV00_005370 [Rhizophlyctis rosea]|nr:hypothetical protein HDV00_005370 [Rhizophlyctis rosea]
MSSTSLISNGHELSELPAVVKSRRTRHDSIDVDEGTHVPRAPRDIEEINSDTANGAGMDYAKLSFNGERHARHISIQEEDGNPVRNKLWEKGMREWLVLTGFVDPPNSVPPKHNVFLDFIISLLLALILLGFAFIAWQFRIAEFSSFWPVNGIYVGCFLASYPRLRRILPFTFAAANCIFSKLTHPTWTAQTVVAFGLTNGLESLVVSLITMVLIGIWDTPGRFIDFGLKKHLLAFGLGCLWCFPSGMLLYCDIFVYQLHIG